ncbi:hypothetical protein GJ496_008984, partial [Pomphorhynchus laevis]
CATDSLQLTRIPELKSSLDIQYLQEDDKHESADFQSNIKQQMYLSPVPYQLHTPRHTASSLDLSSGNIQTNSDYIDNENCKQFQNEFNQLTSQINTYKAIILKLELQLKSLMLKDEIVKQRQLNIQHLTEGRSDQSIWTVQPAERNTSTPTMNASRNIADKQTQTE